MPHSKPLNTHIYPSTRFDISKPHVPFTIFGSLLNRFHMANCIIYITKMSTPYKTKQARRPRLFVLL